MLDERYEQVDLAYAQCASQRIRRKGWIASTRTRLAGEQNWRCCYCCCDMEVQSGLPESATLEHVIPISRGGGRFDEDNLAVACLECNLVRDNALWPIHVEVIVWMTAQALAADTMKEAA